MRTRAKISSSIPTQNHTAGNQVTGPDHVFLNASSTTRSSSDTAKINTTSPSSSPSRPIPSRTNDPFHDAISKLRSIPSNNNNNASSSLARVTFPALPPPPDTRPAARPTFRLPPPPATYRRQSIPSHFGPQPPMPNPNQPVSSPQTIQSLLPMPPTPETNTNNSMEELHELFGMASPAKSGGLDLPDFGVFGPNAADGEIPPDHAHRLPSYQTLVANLLLAQPELVSTPQLQQTPSMVAASPDLELIAPVFSSRKGLQATPNMTPNLTLTPTMASPRLSATGLYDMAVPGQFGFMESEAGPSPPFGSDGLENILHMVNTINPPTSSLPATISPSDVYLSNLTPGLLSTPGPLLDTPSVGPTSPLLETPGRPSVPLVGSTAQAHSSARKRTSPLSVKPKRERSEDNDTDESANKRRKHTGTRPGISSTQLIPPGAPPQQKTYLTESSTSRKDVPASYKVKTGEAPDDATINKIVAKRTANRDSARRSRQRKQQAMEQAQDEIRHLSERVGQLENFIRSQGLEPPPAPYHTPRQELAEDDYEYNQ